MSKSVLPVARSRDLAEALAQSSISGSMLRRCRNNPALLRKILGRVKGTISAIFHTDVTEFDATLADEVSREISSANDDLHRATDEELMAALEVYLYTYGQPEAQILDAVRVLVKERTELQKDLSTVTTERDKLLAAQATIRQELAGEYVGRFGGELAGAVKALSLQEDVDLAFNRKDNGLVRLPDLHGTLLHGFVMTSDPQQNMLTSLGSIMVVEYRIMPDLRVFAGVQEFLKDSEDEQIWTLDMVMAERENMRREMREAKLIAEDSIQVNSHFTIVNCGQLLGLSSTHLMQMPPGREEHPLDYLREMFSHAPDQTVQANLSYTMDQQEFPDWFKLCVVGAVYAADPDRVLELPLPTDKSPEFPFLLTLRNEDPLQLYTLPFSGREESL